MNTDIDNIANRLKRFRKIKQISQDDLAKASGINVSTIKKYESGNRNPKPEQIKKIADALGVSITALLPYDISTLSDVLSLIMKLDQQTNMKISGEKDEKGFYIPSSISFSFSDDEVNQSLAKYLDFKEINDAPNEKTSLNSSIESTTFQYNIDGLLIDIDKQSNK